MELATVNYTVKKLHFVHNRDSQQHLSWLLAHKNIKVFILFLDYFFFRNTPISLHVTSSISSGHAQVRPPFGVGKQRYLQPPLFLKQAFVTENRIV